MTVVRGFSEVENFGVEDYTSFWRHPGRLGIPFPKTVLYFSVSILLFLLLVGIFGSIVILSFSPFLFG